MLTSEKYFIILIQLKNRKIKLVLAKAEAFMFCMRRIVYRNE